MYTAPLPTALVINDDPSQLHLMVGLLEKDGLQVIHCQSAEEALDILDERGTVDVIITDLHMPGIDGWRLCQLLPLTPVRSLEHRACSGRFGDVLGYRHRASDHGLSERMPFWRCPTMQTTFRESIRNLLAGRTPQAAMRVVLVEDSVVQSAILRRAFEAQGYKVSTAATGRRGDGFCVSKHQSLLSSTITSQT